MRVSCWSMSEVLRRDSVSNMWPTWTRRRAWSPARVRAWLCRSSTARASWPISSGVVTGIGLEVGQLGRRHAGGDGRRQALVGHVEGALAHPADRVEQGLGQREHERQRCDQCQQDEDGVDQRLGPVLSARGRSAWSRAGRARSSGRRCRPSLLESVAVAEERAGGVVELAGLEGDAAAVVVVVSRCTDLRLPSPASSLRRREGRRSRRRPVRSRRWMRRRRPGVGQVELLAGHRLLGGDGVLDGDDDLGRVRVVAGQAEVRDGRGSGASRCCRTCR